MAHATDANLINRLKRANGHLGKIIEMINVTVKDQNGNSYGLAGNAENNPDTIPEGDIIEVFKGAGCTECNGRGYTSRVGIFEMMPVTDDIRKLIMSNGDATAITHAARRNGMRNLREDGWLKVRDGITTVEEVMRVTQEI